MTEEGTGERRSFGWPRAMKRRTAAAYLDLSLVEFDREVAFGVIPAGFLLGRSLHWDALEIDKAVDRLTTDSVPDWRIGAKLYCEARKASSKRNTRA